MSEAASFLSVDDRKRLSYWFQEEFDKTPLITKIAATPRSTDIHEGEAPPQEQLKVIITLTLGGLTVEGITLDLNLSEKDARQLSANLSTALEQAEKF